MGESPYVVSTRVASVFAVVFLMFAACSAGSPAESSGQEVESPDTDAKGTSGDDAETNAVPIEEHIEEVAANYPVGGEYVVLFSQNGEYHPVESNRVTLEPQPFQIHVIATLEMAALVHISTDPAARNAVREGRQPEPPIGSPGTAMAGYPHNERQQIIIDPVGSNVWAYNDESTHHFDRVELRDQIFVGHRTVSNLYDNGADETSPVRDAAGMQLHFVEFQPVADDTTRNRRPGRAYTVVFEN